MPEWPHLRFECSMLQAMREGADGKVTWRDMCCEDADDFEELFSAGWRVELDVIEGDSSLHLPEAKPAGWTGPWDMIAALEKGDASTNSVWTSRSAEMRRTGLVEVTDSGSILGRREGPLTRAMKALQDDAASLPAERESRAGRPTKRPNRFSADVGWKVTADVVRVRD